MLHQFAIGAALIVATVIIHAVCLELILRGVIAVDTNFQVRWRALVFAVVILAVCAAHLVEIWIWAIFYYLTTAINQLPTLEAALYFSTSSFTTVGFGDVVLDEDWRLLSSFEAVNGFILFGWSTAFIYSVVQHIYGHIYSEIGQNT